MRLVVTSFLFLSLAACSARATPLRKELVRSEAAVENARRLGAADDPQAALHLRLAQQQLERARALLEDDEAERASWMLIRARTDAELAAVLANENSTRADAQRATEQAEALRARTR